ncbi:MAG: pyrroline-5-carboxylate reductase [Rubrivivax sp.]|nr:pyrroline-5-carboxylate reductase [Rubrivivax sp.]
MHRPSSVIAFVGGGNMAAALIGGLRRAGRPAEAIVVVEPFAAARERLARDFGVAGQAAADERLARAATVVWAVKPQSFGEAAAPCAPFVAGALQVSVMAGVRAAAIRRAAGTARIVRVMPNTPALIGRGVAGLWADASVGAAERAEVQALLAPTGATLWVAQEPDLDAVTALSGSGPAYVFYLLEALIDGATAMGLDPAQARTLALATLDGATALAAASAEPPQALRAQVTSKGGTTAAAISVLEQADVKAAVHRALLAAQRRARELGDEFGG